jgi:uncharacterized OsmC-like protein
LISVRENRRRSEQPSGFGTLFTISINATNCAPAGACARKPHTYEIDNQQFRGRIEMATQNVVNGVNVDQLFGTINAIRETPGLAKFKFRASNKWVHGGHNRTTVRDFYGAGREDTSRVKPFVMDNDEPAVLLGADRGANPVEYALHALAGCLTTSLVYHAAAQGVKIDAVESDFEGDLDLHGFLGLSDRVRSGYENIRVTFKITADAPEEKLRELCELAQKRSPVFDIVSNPTLISVRFEKK